MKSFSRALRIALRYRWTIAGTLACSLIVAAFWGGNIGALYPVIQVTMQGQPLQEWLAKEIDKSTRQVDRYRDEIAAARQAGRQDGRTDDNAHRRQLKQMEYRLRAEERALATRQRMLPWLRKWLPNDPFQTIVFVVGGLMIATVIKGLFMFFNSMLISRLEQRVTYDLRQQFYRQALRMDISAVGTERTSGLLSRFHKDIGNVTSGVKNVFGSAIREPLKMVACLIGASIISWRLLALSLFLSPLILFLIRRLGLSIKRANRRALEEMTVMYGVLSETFNGIQMVQAYTLEQFERNKFYRVSKECLRKAMRIALYSSLSKPITEVLGIGVIAMALVAGAYLALNEQTHLFGVRMCDRPLDVPSLLVFYGLLIGTTEPARKLTEIFNSIQAGLAAAERLFPMLDRQPTIVNPVHPKVLAGRHRQLVFDHVDFHYHPGTPVLVDVDLTVQFGETIAIVGPNGCGKSTLVQLIPRFFDPIRGQLRLDEIDVRDLRLRDLRQRIAIVTQQAILFDDTVFNNIRSGRMDASDAEVYRAAKRARANRFVTEKLTDGYDTVVGTGGCRLSGGQRQRIALARAMLRDPEILILDEATSQIDLQSEKLIEQALEEFARDRTVFIITHRLATLALAHRIVVMNAGRIEAVGTHDELMRNSPLYQKLYSIEFQKSA